MKQVTFLIPETPEEFLEGYEKYKMLLDTANWLINGIQSVLPVFYSGMEIDLIYRIKLNEEEGFLIQKVKSGKILLLGEDERLFHAMKAIERIQAIPFLSKIAESLRNPHFIQEVLIHLNSNR